MDGHAPREQPQERGHLTQGTVWGRQVSQAALRLLDQLDGLGYGAQRDARFGRLFASASTEKKIDCRCQPLTLEEAEDFPWLGLSTGSCRIIGM